MTPANVYPGWRVKEVGYSDVSSFPATISCPQFRPAQGDLVFITRYAQYRGNTGWIYTQNWAAGSFDWYSTDTIHGDSIFWVVVGQF